jgi:phage terminase small subunit
MGRPPHETTDITPFYRESGRLRPPDGLGEAQRKVFVDLVLACPANQFRKSDVHLLTRWAELVVMCETAVARIEAEGMVVDGRHGPKPSPWVAIHRDCCRELRSLSQRLQLGPRGRAAKAPKVVASRTTSYYDRMALEEGDLDDAN